jgi:hypothetical protein
MNQFNYHQLTFKLGVSEGLRLMVGDVLGDYVGYGGMSR